MVISNANPNWYFHQLEGWYLCIYYLCFNFYVRMGLNMRTSKENIWHFVCSSCKGWFSIATMDEWKPKKLYCPHCGEHHTSEVYDKWKDKT